MICMKSMLFGADAYVCGLYLESIPCKKKEMQQDGLIG